MKKSISILVAALFAISAIGTGVYIGINQTQSGVMTYGVGVQTNSVTFSVPFSVAPVLSFSANVTNAYPLTNTAVSTTGFTLETAATNVSVSWTATLPATLLQAGTVTSSLAIATNITVTFPTAYAYAPVVVATGENSGTNSITGVSSVTTTGFTLSCFGATTNNWQAIGYVVPLNAGATTVTK